jgi:hypothetical protein
MRKGAGDLLTSNQANDFYDELVDNGYTMADILDNIIYETLVVSGIISKEDLANIRAEKDKISKMTTEEKKKMAEERKN